MTGIDLRAVEDEFLNQCGSCDAGLPMSCTCTKRDYRPTMLDLVREVERLRAAMSGTADVLGECADVCGVVDEYRAAMLSAVDRLRAAVAA